MSRPEIMALRDESRFPEGPFELPGAEGKWVVARGVTYDYANGDPCRCPMCGGLGIPWAGWFHCDGPCRGIAWIETGEFLVPICGKEKP